jgi:hypothetical protein
VKFERVDIFFERAPSYATLVTAEPRVTIETMSFPVPDPVVGPSLVLASRVQGPETRAWHDEHAGFRIEGG